MWRGRRIVGASHAQKTTRKGRKIARNAKRRDAKRRSLGSKGSWGGGELVRKAISKKNWTSRSPKKVRETEHREETRWWRRKQLVFQREKTEGWGKGRTRDHCRGKGCRVESKQTNPGEGAKGRGPF